MKSFFDLDGPLMRFLDRIAELMALNACFLLCCLPVVTAGAALTALYAALFRREDGGAVRRFFRAFRRDLRQGIALGLILGAAGAVLAADCYLLARIEGYAPVKWIVYLTVPVYLGIGSYAFALAARFEDRLGRILKNAFLLSLSTFPRTALLVLADLFPFLLLLTAPDLFGRSLIVWPLIGFALYAQVKVWIVKDVFAALPGHPGAEDPE